MERSKEIQLLKDIFESPGDAFEFFLKEKFISRKELFKIHFQLILFAPIFKFLSNLISIFILQKFFTTETKLQDGILAGTLFFLGMIFFIHHIDILLSKLRAGENEITELENKDVFLISFLPFSASSLFYFLPKPINFFLIFISLVYSFQLSYLSLRKLLNFNLKQIFVFISYIFIFILFISSLFLFIFKVIK